ncbi:hypothetical protein Q7P37_005485 [Cladosporium fusiforme]
MCQLCSIPTLASSSRWPKPLEQSISDLNFMVKCAHDEHETWRRTHQPSAKVPPPNSLLELLGTITTAIASLECERVEWWKSKTPLIKELKESLDGKSEKKLTELHKINNSAVERIEAMEAKVGGFVRWSLGVEGGLAAVAEVGSGVAGAEDEEL